MGEVLWLGVLLGGGAALSVGPIFVTILQEAAARGFGASLRPQIRAGQRGAARLAPSGHAAPGGREFLQRHRDQRARHVAGGAGSLRRAFGRGTGDRHGLGQVVASAGPPVRPSVRSPAGSPGSRLRRCCARAEPGTRPPPVPGGVPGGVDRGPGGGLRRTGRRLGRGKPPADPVVRQAVLVVSPDSELGESDGFRLAQRFPVFAAAVRECATALPHGLDLASLGWFIRRYARALWQTLSSLGLTPDRIVGAGRGVPLARVIRGELGLTEGLRQAAGQVDEDARCSAPTARHSPTRSDWRSPRRRP
jgi:hypothetical protein